MTSSRYAFFPTQNLQGKVARLMILLDQKLLQFWTQLTELESAKIDLKAQKMRYNEALQISPPRLREMLLQMIREINQLQQRLILLRQNLESPLRLIDANQSGDTVVLSELSLLAKQHEWLNKVNAKTGLLHRRSTGSATETGSSGLLTVYTHEFQGDLSFQELGGMTTFQVQQISPTLSSLYVQLQIVALQVGLVVDTQFDETYDGVFQSSWHSLAGYQNAFNFENYPISDQGQFGWEATVFVNTAPYEEDKQMVARIINSF